MAFRLFSVDKGNYGDVWMWTIKITINTNEIDMDVCFFQNNTTYKSHVCPESPAFFPLVYWFINLNLRDKHVTKLSALECFSVLMLSFIY